MGQFTRKSVLVGFVTKSDPSSQRGLASVATALMALAPNVAYLLYTKQTKPNYVRLRKWIREQPELANVSVPCTEPLPISDPTDYEQLSKHLAAKLSNIEEKHPTADFHLVSGLPQARIIFALCLKSRILQGTLYEVNPPSADTAQSHNRQKWIQLLKQRLEKWPPEIFEWFAQEEEKRWGNVRLELQLPEPRVFLDGIARPLRRRGSLETPRGFLILLLLAARKRYGGGSDTLSKRFLNTLVFQGANDGKGVLETIQRLNNWLSERKHIKGTRGFRHGNACLIEMLGKGEYRLADAFKRTRLPSPDSLRTFFERVFPDYLDHLRQEFPKLYQ